MFHLHNFPPFLFKKDEIATSLGGRWILLRANYRAIKILKEPDSLESPSTLIIENNPKYQRIISTFLENRYFFLSMLYSKHNSFSSMIRKDLTVDLKFDREYCDWNEIRVI